MTNLNSTPLIVALDFADKNAAFELIDKLDPNECQLKVGKALFTRYGPDFVKELMKKNFKIFLDLKFHDIPNTVAGACQAAADLGVWMMNVHASGGTNMMRAAIEVLEPYGNQRPLLIAVTVLTSTSSDDLKEFGVVQSTENVVANLAKLTQDAGLDGVVCSPQEASMLRKELGEKFLLVTPGIRFSEDNNNDQARVMTPQAALEAGANYLVVGRSITQAENPMAVVNKIKQLWS